MLKKQLFLAAIFCCCLFACNDDTQPDAKPLNLSTDKESIALLLDSLNSAATAADFEKYFSFYADDAVFAGTDATERWDKKAFMAWAKPYFDKGTVWKFTAINRNIYFDKTGNLAWFDELLDTQMKICRGSGVVIKEAGGWKIQQYILSVTVPNEVLDTVIAIKAADEDILMKKLGSK